MNYCSIKHNDIADGTGIRVSLFVSGCSHHCKGCFNSVTWSEDSGNPYTLEVENEIKKSLDRPYVSGLTILGGEPMEASHQKHLIEIAKYAKSIGKDVWIYSGYTLEEMLDEENHRCHTDYTKELLDNADILVDGEFIESKKDISLKFRGSSNQRIIDLKKTFADGVLSLA